MSFIDRLTGSTKQPEPAEQSAEPSPLPVTVDEAFFILKNNRGRVVLSVLHGSNSPVGTKELAGVIAQSEHNDPGDPPAGLVKSCRVALLQDHYPLLEKHGLIEEIDGGVQAATDLHPLVSVIQHVERACTVESGSER